MATIKEFITDHLSTIGKDTTDLQCASVLVVDYPFDPLERVDHPRVNLKVNGDTTEFLDNLQMELMSLYTQNLVIEIWFNDGGWSDTQIDYDTDRYYLSNFKAPQIPDTLC